MYVDYLKFLTERDEVQWEILWNKGILLKEFKSPDSAFSLYQIDDYYFKVIRCPENRKILGKSVFYEMEKI